MGDVPIGLVVEQIWRYPVKSMGGERLATAAVDVLGIDGDRRWGVVDRETGRVLTGRREPALLLARARHLGPGRVAITLPDGTETTSDDDLSAWLGRPVALVPSASDPPEFEVPDPEEGSWRRVGAAEGAWHDSAGARLSLVSRATIGDWEPRRFRSNVLLRNAEDAGSGEDAEHGGEAGGEDDLVGGVLRLGTATIDVGGRIRRCVMVNRPLPGVDADRTILRTILDERGGTLAVGATVTAPGTIAEGDVLTRGA